ncbi:MAG: prolipoprotein diacylglyceryl transferase [Chloroflexi bacterium]|jgi:phosphatidylglycerol---prolipoprotein diacylglyceryl transferase|nr:prolipoprotein diacylglyceryl transferase [Chloroflexota bacterium]
MDGIVIDIDPVAFQIGSLEIRWYGIAIAAAVISAMLIAAHEGKKKGILSQDIYSLAIWVVLGGIVGARLFHVLDNFSYYASNPIQMFQFQGLAIWGAVAGGGIAAIIFARMKHIPMLRLADTLVPALLVGQIIGRIGCIINGDAYGGVTGLPWGFIYTHPDAIIPNSLSGVPTHPYPVYEMLWNGAVLLVILGLRSRFKIDGMLFLSYLSLYAVGRLILTFVRQESELFWNLQQAQILAIIAFTASIGMFLFLRYSSRKGDQGIILAGRRTA